jgi:hypothetical protein
MGTPLSATAVLSAALPRSCTAHNRRGFAAAVGPRTACPSSPPQHDPCSPMPSAALPFHSLTCSCAAPPFWARAVRAWRTAIAPGVRRGPSAAGCRR